jgi:hypothetical protein
VHPASKGFRRPTDRSHRAASVPGEPPISSNPSHVWADATERPANPRLHVKGVAPGGVWITERRQFEHGLNTRFHDYGSFRSDDCPGLDRRTYFKVCKLRCRAPTQGRPPVPLIDLTGPNGTDAAVDETAAALNAVDKSINNRCTKNGSLHCSRSAVMFVLSNGRWPPFGGRSKETS